MKIIKIVCGKLQQNTYLVVEGNTTILIDGSASVSEVEENLKLVSNANKINAILLTHAHFDHTLEVENLVGKYNCIVYTNKFGKDMLKSEELNMSREAGDEPFKVKVKKDNLKTFKDGEEIVVGDINIKCFITQGHTFDSSCFVIEDNMFTGDTLFKQSIGRTDLPTSDDGVLKISLLRIRDELSRDINIFYPGHGGNFDRDDMVETINYYTGVEEWT